MYKGMFKTTNNERKRLSPEFFYPKNYRTHIKRSNITMPRIKYTKLSYEHITVLSYKEW